MPASPALAPRGRVRRPVAGVAACALVALAFAPAASAADREITVSATAPAAWEGRAALASALFDPATLTPCGATAADVCDTTLVDVTGAGTLTVELAGLEPGTGDVDLYVYRSDAFGITGAPVAVSTGATAEEAVQIPGASGSYLVAAVSFATGTAGFAGTATLAPRAAAVPDLDSPRGRQEQLVSDVDAGAASQPAIVMSPRDHDLLVAAYRVFADPASYESRIATAVSFDGGRRWDALGAVSDASAANPAVAFDAAGDALLVTNELPGSIVLRRWSRPTERDVRRGVTWQAPSTLAADAVDERPVLARSGATLLACWTRTTYLGAYGRQAVLCRRSADGGVTWAAPVQRSPASTPGVPYGPYVGGVAAAGRGGAFTVAWVDTTDASGLDSAWAAHSPDGVAWSAPVRVARFRSLPERFDGDSFRNVTLLSLAATRARTYLAYAADVGGQADIQLTHYDDGAQWSTPTTVGGDASGADQFQPSLAAAGRHVHVSFLDRRLGGTFVDEWLASSEDRGAGWSAQRLSHDSWDPAVGAPRSPTGDLLGDHQALAADRCTAVALAADPHLANDRRRDPEFDRAHRQTATPQLFAWTVRDRRCE